MSFRSPGLSPVVPAAPECADQGLQLGAASLFCEIR